MGWFNDLITNKYEKMSDHDAGMEALRVFHGFASTRAKRSGHLVFSFDKMIEIISSVRGGTSQINGLGLGIKMVEFSEMEVSRAMMALSRETQGRIPKNLSVFRQALTNEATSYSDSIGGFLDDTALGQAIVKTAAVSQWTIDAGSALVKEVVESTTDILKWRRPVLITAGILAAGVGTYLLVTKAQDIAGMVGTLGKELKRAKK